LPEPVHTEQHLLALSGVHLRHELGNGLGLSPLGSNSDWKRNGTPPSVLSGRGGRCGNEGGQLSPVTSG